jgi:hypothetical protein
MARKHWLAIALGFAFTLPSGASGEERVSGPYAPYAFLIGSWSFGPESGGAAQGRILFRWGPNQSYIWLETSLLVDGKEEPHFEGLLMWNGARKNLDMLLAVDLKGGGAQEQGTLSIQPDGTAVREITLIGPSGSTGRFRQTFRPAGPDRILTSVMRDASGSWVATFPGSDRLVMTRSAKG